MNINRSQSDHLPLNGTNNMNTVLHAGAKRPRPTDNDQPQQQCAGGGSSTSHLSLLGRCAGLDNTSLLGGTSQRDAVPALAPPRLLPQNILQQEQMILSPLLQSANPIMNQMASVPQSGQPQPSVMINQHYLAQSQAQAPRFTTEPLLRPFGMTPRELLNYA